MEKISEMIKRMCPEGVKTVKLKDVGYTYTGLSGKNKDDFKDGNALYVTYSNIFNNPSLNLKIEDRVQINDGEKQNEVLHGDILFTGSSETPEEAGMSSVVLEQPKGRLYLNSFCFGFRLNNMSETYPHYMRYILRDNKVRKFISKTAFGVTRFNINKERMLEVEIPLPPLPIQQEIVRVLDSFTQLQSNLEAELVVRQKQYEFYRDFLFSEDVDTLRNRIDCEVKTIGELGTLTRGKRFVRTDIVEQGVPCIHYGDMYTYYGLKAEKANTHITREKAKSMRFAKKGDVVVVGAGENDWDIGVGLVWLGEEDAAIHDACYILEHKQNPMYISHFLRSTVYHLQLRKYVSSGKISSFSAKDLAKIYIPIPSLQRQQEIVSILDTFESLITNLKKEIEARKKQYEYYREQLLTFE